MSNIYGVTQYDYGHEYRFLFREEDVRQNMFDGKEIEDGISMDCGWPIGGSNASATWASKLADDEDIKAFLIAEAYGPDLEDPMLIDIGEYLLSVSGDYDSCTDEYVKKLGLSYDSLVQTDDQYHRRAAVTIIAAFLKSRGVTDFDCDNPFYGDNSDMRFSDLCDRAEKEKSDPVFSGLIKSFAEAG